MGFIRSKKFVKNLEHLETFFNSTSCVTVTPPADAQPSFPCSYISQSIWDDIDLTTFVNGLSKWDNTKEFIKYTIQHPVIDPALLEARQSNLLTYASAATTLPNLMDEKSVATWNWLLTLEDGKKNYIMETLYPNSWPFKWLYLDPLPLNLYHIYRCYLAPVAQSIYPLSMVLGPYIYLRTKLKWKMSLKAYLSMIYKGLKWMYSFTKTQIKQLVMLLIYIGIYLYSFVIVIDFSNQLRRYRNIILDRLKTVETSIRRFQEILTTMPSDFWKAYEPNIERTELMKPLKQTAVSFYNYWKTPETRADIHRIYKAMVIYDGIRSMSQLLKQDWCLPTYSQGTNKPTYLGGMKHPILANPIENPIQLKKHLVITGPNAAGKTTYVKSLLWNILMGQSFGLTRANYSHIQVYDAIFHHDRIKDVIGSKSLFEAEMMKAQEVIEKTKTYKQSIYFMDEPLHSTPPLDGSSMLKALMLHLAKRGNIHMVLTTHYFTLQELAKEYPQYFKNVCMEAIPTDKGFQFPYLIKNGYSTQSIGIELLQENAFPESLIQTAIKMKNKICALHLNV